MFKLSLVVLNNEYFIIKVNLICGFWFPLIVVWIEDVTRLGNNHIVFDLSLLYPAC